MTNNEKVKKKVTRPYLISDGLTAVKYKVSNYVNN